MRGWSGRFGKEESIRNPGQPLVGPDRRVLKLPGALSGWRGFLPLHLPCESFEKRAGNDGKSQSCELGILLGGFRKSKLIQLRVDLNRHCAIIPSVTLGWEYQ